MSLDSIKLSLEPRAYDELLNEAIASINASPSALNIRGINDPAYVLLGTYLYLAQYTIESFTNATATLALNLIDAKGISTRQATKATGTVQVVLPSAIVISESTITSPSGITFVQTSPAVYAPANTPVSITYESELFGSTYNSPETGDLSFLGYSSSINGAALSSNTGFIGGSDLETDESLLSRGNLALSQLKSPVSKRDWIDFTIEVFRDIDSSVNPIVFIDNSWTTENLPSLVNTCANQVTRPDITLYVARSNKLSATNGELSTINTRLQNLRPIHSRLSVLPMVITDVQAKVVVEASVSAEALLPDVVAIFNESFRSLDAFVQHRLLLSKVSRLSGVLVAEEIWLAEVGNQLKPDNLHVGLELPYLKDLELVVVGVSGNSNAYYVG